VLAAPLAGFAPLLGVHGISWLLALTAAVGVLLVRPLSAVAISRRGRSVAMAALAVTWTAGHFLHHAPWSEPVGRPLTVALLQGNIEQSLKWREDQRDATLENYRELLGRTQAKLVVMLKPPCRIFSMRYRPGMSMHRPACGRPRRRLAGWGTDRGARQFLGQSLPLCQQCHFSRRVGLAALRQAAPGGLRGIHSAAVFVGVQLVADPAGRIHARQRPAEADVDRRPAGRDQHLLRRRIR
jgi:hypothetical protein